MSKNLFNQPVMSLRLGRPIAVAVEPVINPHNLQIAGWWCRAEGSQLQVLLAEDVREVLPQGLAVNDESALSDPEDLVRQKDVLNLHFELINKAARTKLGKLGKVTDFAYDSDSLFIRKIYVSRPLTKLLAKEDLLIIDRTQIVEVTDSYVMVRDVDVKVGAEDMAGAVDAVPAG